ncbi:hypothetical protein ACFDTO_32750 [Microbacteriaceae bacterium 4G12]
MIVKMKRQEFDSLAHEELCKSCFEPLIQIYKSKMTEDATDHNSMAKELFYYQLTTGQRALFMFHVFYNHAIKSLEEFYWWSAYFMAQPKTWSAIKAGLQYFGDSAMLLLFEEMEKVLKKHNHPISLEGFTVTREDLNHNRELLVSIQSLHSIFNQTTPLTLAIISENIRNNQREFVQLEQ